MLRGRKGTGLIRPIRLPVHNQAVNRKGGDEPENKFDKRRRTRRITKEEKKRIASFNLVNKKNTKGERQKITSF